MPGYKTHIFGGVLFGGAAVAAAIWYGYLTTDPGLLLALMSLAVLGALFPDVDTNSKGQNFFYALLVLVDLALMVKGLYKWAAVLGFFAMLPAIGNHRGWTHTWWAALLVPLPIIALPMIFYDKSILAPAPFYLAVVAGYFSHLVFDRLF